MSRILDYILEPNVVYTNGAFLIKVKVQDSYKYKKLLVTDNMKYRTLKGSTFFFFNATSQNNASCLDIEGNTYQNGTPSPTSPVEVDNVSKDNEIVVSGKNLSPQATMSTINGGYVNYTTGRLGKVTQGSHYVLSFKNNSSYTNQITTRITFADNTFVNQMSKNLVANSTMVYSFTAAATGDITLSGKVTNDMEDIFTEIQLENGSTATTYEPYQGSSYRIDLGGKNIMIPKIISTTTNGITATYDQDTQTFTFNGTCTANNTTFTLGDNAVNFKTGITRSSVHYVSGSVTSYCQIRNFDNDYSYSCNYSILSLSASNPVIYATSQYDFVCPRDRLSNIRFNNGSVANNFKIKVMVADNLDTTYSPYVSNPIELCKIGDYADTLKKARGINVAQFTTTQDTSKYTYSSFLANNISVNKTATGGSFYASFILHIPYAGTYAITGNALGTQQLYIYTDSLWGTLKESFTVQAGDFNRGTIFTSAGDYVIGLYGSATGNYSVKNFMCFEGVTAEPYEPYISHKNLFNKYEAINGYFISTTNGNNTNNTNWTQSNFIKVDTETDYTISSSISFAGSGYIELSSYDNNYTWQSSTQIGNNGSKSATFTTGNNVEYIRIGVYKLGTSTDNIQLEKGSVATAYSEYAPSNWYVEKNIGKVVLNGANTEDWQYSNPVLYTTDITNYAISNNIPICSHYKGLTNVSGAGAMGNNANNTIAFINVSGGTTPRLYIKDTNFTNVTNWRTWLGSNPMTLYYQLANPTYEIITNDYLIEQLEAAQNMYLVDNLCYVDWEGIIPAIFTLQYPTTDTINDNIVTEDNKLIRTEWGS